LRLRDELDAVKSKEVFVQEEIQQDFAKLGEQLYLTETKFNEPEMQHITIDQDEKGNAKNLEEKYHLMKKKLKKQKEVAESQEGEIEELR